MDYDEEIEAAHELHDPPTYASVATFKHRRAVRAALWWGLGLLAIAISAQACMARYEWRIEKNVVIRIDRWTGGSVVGRFGRDSRWASLASLKFQDELDRASAAGESVFDPPAARSQTQQKDELERAISDADAVLSEKAPAPTPSK